MAKDSLAVIMALISLAVIFTSCHYSPNEHLVKIEKIIEEFPDSALHEIESYELPVNSSEGDKFLYNLLLSYAKYKNYINENNDSNLIKSSEYFIKNGTPIRAAMSFYTLGMLQMNIDKLGEAVVSLNIGLDIATKNGLAYWEGQCSRGLFLLYGMLYDCSAQIIYSQKEYAAFSKAGLNLWIGWSKLDIGTALFNNGQYEKAASETKDLIRNYNCESDSLLLGEAYSLLADVQFALGQYSDAILNYYGSYRLGKELTNNELSVLSIAIAKADTTIMDSELTSFTSDILKTSKDKVAFSVWAETGDYEEAYHDLIKYKNEQDSVLSVIVYNNVSESLNNYEKTSEIIRQKQLINERLIWIVLILSLFIIIGIVVIIQRIKISHKESVLQKTVYDLECMKADFADLIRRNKLLSESFINSLYEKYKKTNSLCDSYYEKRYSFDKKDEYEILIDGIKKEFSDKECLLQIEDDVDKYSEGLFSSFKKDFPRF